jgi:hypothetical protein
MKNFWEIFLKFLGLGRTARRAKSKINHAEIEEAGRWYFRRDILDRLDEYLICIRRMSKTDPEGYRMYSKIGASVLPPKAMVTTFLDDPRWRVGGDLPAFGAIATLGSEPRADFFYMKFGYYRRLDKPPYYLERTNRTVYQVTVFHTRVDDDTRWGRQSDNFFVGVDKGGDVVPLRYVVSTKSRLKHRGGKRSSFPRREWTYGAFLAVEDPEAGYPGIEAAPRRAKEIFSIIVSGSEGAGAALRVSAGKGRVTAVFGIDLLRTPYFFSDRDPVYAEEGHKKRIFHIVRTHERKYQDGSSTYVKSHFRGLRRFAWNGYAVLVSMPGFHHTDLLDARMGAHIYEKDEPQPPGFMDDDEAATLIAEHLNR